MRIRSWCLLVMVATAQGPAACKIVPNDADSRPPGAESTHKPDTPPSQAQPHPGQPGTLELTATSPRATPEMERENALEAAKARIRSEVFDSMRKTRFEGAEITARRNPDGDYEVMIPLQWSIDPAPILETLNAYFWDVGQRPLIARKVDFSGRLPATSLGLIMYRSFNRGAEQRVPYAEALFEWLTKQELIVVLQLGAQTRRLTLATGRSCPATLCRGPGNQQYQIHFAHTFNEGGLIVTAPMAETEPVKFTRVPASEFAHDGRLDTKRLRVCVRHCERDDCNLECSPRR